MAGDAMIHLLADRAVLRPVRQPSDEHVKSHLVCECKITPGNPVRRARERRRPDKKKSARCDIVCERRNFTVVYRLRREAYDDRIPGHSICEQHTRDDV